MRTNVAILSALCVMISCVARAQQFVDAAPPGPVMPVSEGRVEPWDQLQQKLAELDRVQSEVDALRVAAKAPSMIVVNVELLEVPLTKMRKLGIEVPRFTSGVVTSASFAERVASDENDDLGAVIGSRELTGFIKALKQNYIGKTLADPQLVTTSGKPASLHVGGQFPMPMAPDSSGMVDHEKWGTELDVLTESLGNGQVRLHIRSRISEPSDQRSIEVAGQRVPSLNVRQFNTTCETTIGEPLVISGMTERRVESVKSSDGQVSERVSEIVLWMIVRLEDAAREMH